MEEIKVTRPQYRTLTKEELDDAVAYDELIQKELRRIAASMNLRMDRNIENIIMADAWKLAERNRSMEKRIWELKTVDSYRGVYLSCLSGWVPLIEPLVDFVLDNGGTVHQVKEKFGGLRFYYTPNTDEYDFDKWEEFDKLVRKAENDSYKICEVTGKPGVLMTNGSWVRTLSGDIAKEYGYDTEVDMHTRYSL